MGDYQRTGELRFIVTMKWENISNPYGTIAYYDDDRKITKDYGSLTDMLFQMDAACDEQGHPQRDTVLRSFGKTPLLQDGNEDKTEIHSKENKQKTLYFVVAICMRQHSSMQGFVQAKDEKVSFRSEMELLKLLRELLESEKMRINQRM